MYDALLPCTLLAAIGLVLLHAQRYPLSRWLRALLVLVCTASIYAQTIMMSPLTFRSPDQDFRDAYGYGRPALFHIHEIFHYYIGGKYFPEIGYRGLYEAAVLADSESEDPFLNDDNEIRSLRDPRWWIYVPEARTLGLEEFRPNFTDERWEAFKADVETIKRYSAGDDFLGIVNDVGYNPPPTWANLGHAVASVIPITEEDAWFPGLRPHWYQILWLPWIDVAIITAAMVLVARTFGLLPVAAFIGLYTCSYAAQYNWTSGSLLRWTWLCELIAGACLLRRERWGWAGVFMALSSLDRIFPAAFLAGACIPLFWRGLTQRQWRPFVHFAGAAAVAGAAWFGLSVWLFGLHAWVEFFEKINLHRSLIFIHCLGYQRIATFEMGITDPFWDDIGGWNGYNEIQNATWQHWRWVHYPIMTLLVALSALASLRRPAYETALMFGSMAFFVSQIATSYYYIFFPLCAVVIMGTESGRNRERLLFAAFLTQFMTWFNGVLTDDSVIHHTLISVEYGAFFLYWAGLRAWQCWGDRIRAYCNPPETPQT